MNKLLEGIFGTTTNGLHKMLDLTYRRNEAIVSNVANSETPQYRAVDLNFAGELQRAFGQRPDQITRTNPKHIDITRNGEAHLSPDYSGQTRADGNNVDIDIQMGRLAYNSGRYSIAANLMRRHLQLLKLAIREGGR